MVCFYGVLSIPADFHESFLVLSACGWFIFPLDRTLYLKRVFIEIAYTLEWCYLPQKRIHFCSSLHLGPSASQDHFKLILALEIVWDWAVSPGSPVYCRFILAFCKCFSWQAIAAKDYPPQDHKVVKLLPNEEITGNWASQQPAYWTATPSQLPPLLSVLPYHL